MRVEYLQEFTRRRPFAPFRVHVSDGRLFQIHHPDQAMPLLTRVVIGVGAHDDVPDHLERIALSPIVRIEEMETEAPAERA